MTFVDICWYFPLYLILIVWLAVCQPFIILLLTYLLTYLYYSAFFRTLCTATRTLSSLKISSIQGLKWGRVARVGDPAPFDLPGLYRVSCLLSGSSKSHKIPLRMHQNSPFSDKKASKLLRRGNSTSDCGETRLLFWTTLSTASIYVNHD